MNLKNGFLVTVCVLIVVFFLTWLIVFWSTPDPNVKPDPAMYNVQVMQKRYVSIGNGAELFVMFGKGNDRIELSVPTNLFNSIQENLTVNITYDKDEMKIKTISFPNMENNGEGVK